MQIPTEITFHGVDHSDAAEAAIMRWVARIEHLSDHIEKCTVVVGQPHRHHRHPREFHITVLFDVPGPNIAVSRVGDVDIYVTIADAFRAARRQLLDQQETQRGFVKTHAPEQADSMG